MTFCFRRKKRGSRIKSEVNLTPLIDVMTSLLAIFMITAPLLTSGMPLDLPKGDGKVLPGEERVLDLSIDRNGQIFIAQTKVEEVDILPKLKAIVSENPNISMVISADKNVSYGHVIELMGMLRAAGYIQVGLKTDVDIKRPEEKRKK